MPRLPRWRGLGKSGTYRPPRPGEHFRIRMANSWEGIANVEIPHMVEMVREGIGDPLVIDQAGWNLLTIEDDEDRRNYVEMARAQFHWVRGATHYVPDPVQMEKTQTANRMIRMAKIPREVILAATAPIYASKSGRDLGEMTMSELGEMAPNLATRVNTDCDEAVVLCATLVSACGIPTRFMLGSNDPNGDGFHHIWAEADIYGDGSNESFAAGAMDPTEPEFDDLGKFAEMARYKPVEIFA